MPVTLQDYWHEFPIGAPLHPARAEMNPDKLLWKWNRKHALVANGGSVRKTDSVETFHYEIREKDFCLPIPAVIGHKIPKNSLIKNFQAIVIRPFSNANVPGAIVIETINETAGDQLAYLWFPYSAGMVFNKTAIGNGASPTTVDGYISFNLNAFNSNPPNIDGDGKVIINFDLVRL